MSRLLVVGDVVDDVLVRQLAETSVASDTKAEIDQQPGGSAANVAAWLGRAGAGVTFVGRAGHQGVDRHVAALEAHGVDARISGDASRPTAAVVLLVDPAGERTMYVDRGANSCLTPADVPVDAWHGAGWLHLTGYTFFDPEVRGVAIALVRQAAAAGVGVSVDPSSSAFLRAAGPDAFLAWTSGTSLVTPNVDEATVLTGETDPVRAGRALVAHYPEVVVTCGRDGAVHCTGGADPLWSKAMATDVIDSTGAGDAFCAGLLAARSAGADLPDQLAAGARLAAEAVSRLGARPAP